MTRTSRFVALFGGLLCWCGWHLVLAANHGDMKSDPLFGPDHPNITYLTDDNWDSNIKQTLDKPWLVDFYHPFCPHCKSFAPTFEEVAAYYKVEGSIHIGAVSCMDHVICRYQGIKGFPTLMGINFNSKELGENRRVVGTHTFQEVIDYVNEVYRDAKFNETGTYPPTIAPATPVPGHEPAATEGSPRDSTDVSVLGDAVAPTPTRTGEKHAPGVQSGEHSEIWELSPSPMNHTTRIRDAASAFVFGLRDSIFMGREWLEDEELDALKDWLHIVEQTFPGRINRRVIHRLTERVEELSLLNFELWDKLVKDWQAGSVAHFLEEEAKLDYTGLEVPEWQRISDLFTGMGFEYTACAEYTCGQWNMFHMMTMNPPDDDPVDGPRKDELFPGIVASIRRFMKHYFGCVNCAQHFLKYNTLERVKEIANAPNKPLAIKMWLWKMHNTVNKRLKHPFFPKPENCPTCGTGPKAWVDDEVAKALDLVYVYRDVNAPLKNAAPAATEHAHTQPVAQDTHDSEPPAPTEASLHDPTEPLAPTEPPTKTNIDGHVDLQAEHNKASIRKETNDATGSAVAAHDEAPQTTKKKGYVPKDFELGIENDANTLELEQVRTVPVLDAKERHVGPMNNMRAPPMSIFAWYLVPVVAVGGYFVFVRSRAAKSARRVTK